MKTIRFLSFVTISATCHDITRIWEKSDGTIIVRVEDKIRHTNNFLDGMENEAREILDKSPETIVF